MLYLVEHRTDARAQFALCATFSDVELIAADVAGEELELGAPEGELEGDWGVLRYAPAA